MSPLPELSNEQKLTYIYHTLKDQEARHKRAVWYRIFKWIIVLGFVYVIATYPGYIFTKVSEMLRPIIVEQAQTLLDQNRNDITKGLNSLMKNIKVLLAETATESFSLTPTAPSVIPPKKVTPPATSTGTSQKKPTTPSKTPPIRY